MARVVPFTRVWWKWVEWDGDGASGAIGMDDDSGQGKVLDNLLKINIYIYIYIYMYIIDNKLGHGVDRSLDKNIVRLLS